ncbi:MAG: iron-containing alcohol dehydrogenase [Lachnospiraceae bacterium]|nr:iron-containing alcohol dehydrogenase [Lachnospiraceae bacterium]
MQENTSSEVKTSEAKATADKAGAVKEAPKKPAVKKTPYIDYISCAGCSVCVENCPRDCLKLTPPRFHGDIHSVAYMANKTACISCGICEKVCPIEALTMVTPGTVPDNIAYSKEKNCMGRVYCRVFQGVMKVANYFLGYRTPEYIEGAGSIKKLPALIKAKGIKNVMLVTDNGLMKIGIPNGLIEALKEEGLQYTLFSDIQPNPTDENVEAGFKLFKENGCEALIAMGGGSPMDCAKGIAAKNAHPNKPVAKLQGILKVHKKIVPFWAVPTTSGTGSETTVAAVITEAKTHHKASINDPAILPKYAVLDPELTMGLPPFITATTGLDALCHAVESYTNWTYCTSVEKDLSKKAVKLIYENLYKAFENGKDLEARQNMQLAAFYAGRSFTRGCVGYVHAVGHTLGGLYGVPHGLAMAVILPHVMRQFGSSVYDRLADLSDECGFKGTNEEKALAFIGWMDEMKKKMNLPAGLDMIKDEDIPQIIAWADKEANPLYPVPVIWGYNDFERLINTLRTAD